MSITTLVRAKSLSVLGVGVAIAGVVVSLQVVTSPASASQSLPAIGKIPSESAASNATFPLASYGISDTDVPVIMQARHIGEQTCMQRLGFTGYIPQVYNDRLTASEVSIKANFLRSLNPVDAAKYGYHLPSDVAKVSSNAFPSGGPQLAVLPETRINEYKAYEGIVSSVNGHKVPLGGCKAWSNSRLYRGIPYGVMNTADARMLSATAQFSAMSDGRLIPAIHAWSSCMKSHGLNFGAPWDAQGDHFRKPDALFHTNPSLLEKSTAVADANCRKESNLFGTWVAVRTAWENKIIKQSLVQLERGRADDMVMLKNAREMVAGNL